MQAARISGEGGLRGGFVAGTEHDDVATFESVAFIEFRVERTGTLGDEISTQASAVVGEGATDDLLHFPVM